MRKSQAGARGFTLMDVIGVMAVIAIIAAVATPRIFAAIEDARINAIVQQSNDVKTAIAAFYKDTGRWPRHTPTSTNDYQRQLMRNALDSSGAAIPGWQGPYMDQEMVHPLTPGTYQEVLISDVSAYACDLDGDTNPDGTFAVYRIDGVDDEIAEKISHLMDRDGGAADWRTAGKVKRYNGTHASVLVICMARV